MGEGGGFPAGDPVDGPPRDDLPRERSRFSQCGSRETTPRRLPVARAFRIPAGAKLHLQIYYKKTWQDEQQTKSDQSTVGLYFTDEPLSGKDIQSFAVDGPR